MIDPTGTRHELRKTAPQIYDYNYQSTDGTQIHFNGSVRSGGTLTYPDGTRIRYGGAQSGQQRIYPTMISDAQGNQIFIYYFFSSQGASIAYIEDTMNRYVRFYLTARTERAICA